MPSYLITGANRGIGFGFLDYLSRDAKNVLIGLVRNKAAADAKVAEKLPGRTNVHLIQGDMTDLKSLKNAAETAASITGGSLDVFIANANVNASLSLFDPLSELGSIDDSTLQDALVDAFNTNVVGNIYLTNALLPLIRKGKQKRAVFLSSAMGDADFQVEWDLYENGPYSISKAALNMAVAKYHAKHKDEGILFMAISPGVVDTGNAFFTTPEDEQAKMATMFGKFQKYAPDMKGPITVEESVTLVMGVVDNATFERTGGRMVSQHGNTQWI